MCHADLHIHPPRCSCKLYKITKHEFTKFSNGRSSTVDEENVPDMRKLCVDLALGQPLVQPKQGLPSCPLALWSVFYFEGAHTQGHQSYFKDMAGTHTSHSLTRITYETKELRLYTDVERKRRTPTNITQMEEVNGE